MTRPFGQFIDCPNCNSRISMETDFSRWVRENPSLDSKNGYCIIDQDFWIDRFKTHGNREFQCMMLVEIKTMGASLTLAQRDTLVKVNQLMRNRRQTPTKDLRWQAGYSPVDAYSPMTGRRIKLRAFGMHVLTFSGRGPNDSDVILWDRKEIDIDMLTSILRFDLDPDTLKPIDLRNHHRTHENQTGTLFGFELA